MRDSIERPPFRKPFPVFRLRASRPRCALRSDRGPSGSIVRMLISCVPRFSTVCGGSGCIHWAKGIFGGSPARRLSNRISPFSSRRMKWLKALYVRNPTPAMSVQRNYISGAHSGMQGSDALVFEQESMVVGRGYQRVQRVRPRPRLRVRGRDAGSCDSGSRLAKFVAQISTVQKVSEPPYENCAIVV